MLSTTHSFAGGAAAGAATLLVLPGHPAPALAALAFGTIVAGELPDLDAAGSKISRARHARQARGLMRTPLLVLAIPAVLLGLLLRPLLKPLGRLGEHRGATHTLIGLALFTLLIPPVYLASSTGVLHLLSALHPALEDPTKELRGALADHTPTFLVVSALSTLAGVASHLALDALTPSGVALAAPFSPHRFQFPLTIRTGSLAELPVSALMFILWILVLLQVIEL